jgi:hypothetical protein
MGHLNNPQITVLALYSFGMILAHTSGLTRVVAALADHFEASESDFRQQLREWTHDWVDKRGIKRLDLPIRSCFAPLMRWILSLWDGEEHRLVLAMDATSLKKVFVVLSISVVYRGCAIPVAWAILPEGQKGAWKGPWMELFAALRGSIPADWQVLVLADRGLYARWVYQIIRTCGWHPFLRINERGSYHLPGQTRFSPIRQLVSAPDQAWAGQVTCFAHNSVEGATLLVTWETGYAQPWFILTDLPPQDSRAAWYGMRSWIEGGFKDLKRDGWDWQKTRMTDPHRAARLWLVLAIATLWVVSVGGEADQNLPASSLEHLPPTHIARRTKRRTTPPRALSCFSRGFLRVLANLIAQRPIVLGSFLPEPWPSKTYP